MNIFFQILKLLLGFILFLLGAKLRTPFLSSIRIWVFLGIIFLEISLLYSELIKFQNQARISKLLSFFVLILASSGLIFISSSELHFYALKYKVLNADTALLEKLGQHFIIGYRDFQEIQTLVQKKAVGGVFLKRRNINKKTIEEIQQEIQTLQNIRSQQGLPPLWIAADQEGGIVSSLSPPLTKLPPLSQVIADKKDAQNLKNAVIEYAQTQGKELSNLGINVNFSPVVDLNKNIINEEDKYSQIYRRAIAEDKNVVSNVAQWYCQTLAAYNVRCTLKHFPGLGRVEGDTHLQSATLKTSIQELQNDDWVPFQKVMSNTDTWAMLSHVILTEIDSDRPTSFSKPVVTGILRDQWHHEGILVTDDFCMYAVYKSKYGIQKATVDAINAGVDIILIAYDKDLYYSAMNALLEAERKGMLGSDILKKSHQRLHSNNQN